MVKTSPYNSGGAGSIPGQGAKIPHALGLKNQNIKEKQYCNKFNKDFKNGPHQKNLKKKKKKTKLPKVSTALQMFLPAWSNPVFEGRLSLWLLKKNCSSLKPQL